MLLLVAALILFGQSSALNKNGYVNRSEAALNRNIKTEYCFQCLEVEITSTGGAVQYQANRLGRSENGQYLTPGPTSNPGYKSIPWVISGIKTQGPQHPIEAKI